MQEEIKSHDISVQVAVLSERLEQMSKRIDERVEQISKRIDTLFLDLKEREKYFATRKELDDIKQIVYGACGFILLAFLGSVASAIWK